MERIQKLIKELQAIKSDIDYSIGLMDERRDRADTMEAFDAYDWTHDILVRHIDRLDKAINKYSNNN